MARFVTVVTIFAWVFISSYVLKAIGLSRSDIWWANLLLAVDFFCFSFFLGGAMLLLEKFKLSAKTDEEDSRELNEIMGWSSVIWFFGTAFFLIRGLLILIFGWSPLSGFVQAIFKLWRAY